MQLSLLSEMPELEKRVFLDVFAKAYYDKRLRKARLKTIEGQLIPADLKIGCPCRILSQFPEGTIYKLDVRLVLRNGRQPYFLSLNHHKIQRALEFFDHNIQVQQGLKLDLRPKKMVFYERHKRH